MQAANLGSSKYLDRKEIDHGGAPGVTGAKFIAETFKGYGITHVFFVEAILRKSLVEMEAIFKDQGLRKDQELIFYCHIGMQLTTVYTAAKILGYENVRIYDGSFYEWSPDDSLPVTTETE